MNIRKVLRLMSLGLLLIMSISGCNNGINNKVNETKEIKQEKVGIEEVFTTIPEESLATEYLKTKMSKESSFIDDGSHFINLYFFDITTDSTQDLISKYNLNYSKDVVFSAKDLCSQYRDLYDVGMTALYNQIHVNGETGETFVNEKLKNQIINYIVDVWMNEENADYALADEFKEKNPKEVVQNYLKENKITITDITYPKLVTGFNYQPGLDIATVKITMKGEIDKTKFEKNVALDFYFAPSEEIRNGDKLDETLSDTDFKIMGVSTGTVSADEFDTFFQYNPNVAKEKFGID